MCATENASQASGALLQTCCTYLGSRQASCTNETRILMLPVRAQLPVFVLLKML